MFKKAILLLLFISFSGYSQNNSFDYKAEVAKIRKHINSSPDSVKIILDYIFSQPKLHDTIRGNATNIYAIYYSNTGKPDSAIIYYKKSIALLKNYPHLKTLPLMNISAMYRDKGEYKTAFSYLEEALEINKKLKLKVNEAIVYGNMCSLYQYMLEYDKAVENALKAIKILKEEKDVRQLAATTQKLANTYLKMKNFNFAKDMYLECLSLFKSIGDDRNYYYTLINYAEVLIHLGDYKNAENSLNKALSGLKKINDIEHTGIAHSKLGYIYKLAKKNDKALDNYRVAFDILKKTNSFHTTHIASYYIELLNDSKNYTEAAKVIEETRKMPVFSNINIEDKMRFEKAIAQTYVNTQDDKKAIEALKKVITAKDSLSSLSNERITKEVQAKFQSELQREKNIALAANNKVLEQKVDTEKKLTWLSILIGATLLILVLLYLRTYVLKNKLQKQQLRSIENEKSFIEQQHKADKKISQARQEMIEEKQRELTSMALRMANYQDKLSEILAKCENNEFAHVADVKRELQHLMKQKDYWKQFETRFNNLHPDFNVNLTNRFDKLTKNDLEFCSLLKLKLSNKEIASLLQISHESTITKKYRIKKKMNITDDYEFEKLLMEI